MSRPSLAQVKGYYPTYNAKAQPPSKIDWSAYTDVLFFMLVTEFVAEARKNHVNPLFSTGGWTGSQHFSNLTLTEAGRKKFAKSLVDFGKKTDANGQVLAVTPASGRCCQLRVEIRALWPQADLTAAVGITGLIGADGGAATTTETALLTQTSTTSRNSNLMAYDVYGAWAPTTVHSPHSTRLAPPPHLVNPSKLVSRSSWAFRDTPSVLIDVAYSGANYRQRQSSFYYQNHTTPGGNFDDKPGKDICGNARAWGGSFLVNELISNGWLSKDQKTGLNGYKRHWDACSGQPFLTNGKYLITYDDLDSTIAKAKFAKQNQLGGIYFFDTMGPTPATVRAARQAVY
ncbi:hypothetical protein H4Q26_012751 [Puccinia striiformis f. sp. tritici PST-130]|nr:hypothetical protein H4Q26_012751 [Puccinia striiformis f. sp. tritici PST-130]